MAEFITIMLLCMAAISAMAMFAVYGAWAVTAIYRFFWKVHDEED